MKILIIILSLFLAVSTGVSAQMDTKSSKNEIHKTAYACSTNPDEVNLESGKCTKCGMEMAKTSEIKYNHTVKGSQANSEVVTKYVCNVDSVTSEKSCKSSKCGVSMARNEVQETNYTCPIHPNEVSLESEKCSKCKMELVKTKKFKYNQTVKGSQSSRKVVTEYVCIMDDTTSDKADKCSKC